MDDSEDEDRYLTKPSFRSKPAIRNPLSYPRNTHYPNDVVFAQEDDEFDDEEQNPQFQNAEGGGNFYQPYYGDDQKRIKKKRKLGSLLPNYDIAPLNPLKSYNLGGGSSRDSAWNEEESFVLLDVWGERYLELGRRSLRAEDWVELAEKVSEMSGRERNEMECRNMLDVLKKKYKKERVKMEKFGGGFLSKWVFFKKMDALLNLRMRGHCGLGCGVDSGEYVFMNPRVYLDKSSVLDEMRDSPGVSDEENEEDEDGFGRGEDEEVDGESARVLADSIQRFGEIYEKIESSKRRQMMDLEKMRKDFQRELESQKKQIVERAHAEIAIIREGDEEEDEEDDDDDDDDDDDNVPNENVQV
ncbi:hypothetical protein ACH5RR_004228 [Cinchona calisaya]|uniref:Myb/SANT-like DNA-binding domain-containing protein n=1 Tax=Cinchona calisaya TaxID=153742 RepID=A0ABD3AXV0_9GENT